jgi:type I restriction enzyme, S subunit
MVNGKLPDGWKIQSLNDVVNGGLFVDGDWVESKDQDPNGDVRLIQLADIGDGYFRNRSDRFLTTQKAKELGCTFLEKGDLLVARMPDPLGRACIFPGDHKKCVTVVDVCVIRTSNVNHRWLMHTMNSPQCRADIESMQSGSTRKRISRKNLEKIVLPVPPLPEQERLVARIEELFTQLEAGTSALAKVQAGLRRYKASVLKAAVEGKLGVQNDEGRMENGGLPEGWRKVNLGNILSEPLSNGKSTPNAAEGFPVLRLTALKDGRIDLREKKIGAWTREQARNYLVKSGDFFVSRGNGSLHLVGRGGLVELESFDDVAYPDTLIRIRIATKECDIRYLRTIWNSNYIRNQIETTARTTAGIYKINQKDLESFTFPLPPFEEQRQIVAEVERRLSVAREVESAVEGALVRASRLRQAVLKSAFEGRL